MITNPYRIPPPFDADVYGNTHLWLDPSDSNTLFDLNTATFGGGGSLPADGETVERWEDKSVNNFVYYGGGTKPYRTVAGINGLDAVNFGNQAFQAQYPSGGASTLAGSFTYFHIFTRPLNNENSTSMGGALYMFYWDSTSSFKWGRWTANQTSVNNQPWSLDTGTFLVSMTRASNNDTDVFLNGLSISSANKTGTAWFDKLGGGQYHGGMFGEIIIYDGDISTANRQEIETHLMTKWGVTPL